jgi:hypothetical protein
MSHTFMEFAKLRENLDTGETLEKWYKPAQDTSSSSNSTDWSTWKYKVKIAEEGNYRIIFRAADGFGNKAWYSLRMHVTLE